MKVTGQNSSETYAQGTNLGKTETLTSSSTKTSYIDFVYKVQDPDEFTFNIAKADVVLTGVTDLYGNEQGSQQLDEDYSTRSIKCDGVAPKVIKMIPDGETSSGSNIYSGGKTITLNFNEPVKKASGKITIRRTYGWSIPPVLTASEFTTITNKLTAAQKNILSLQENGIDMEDSESLYQANIGTANIYYHGTGQFAGPYKKSTHGLKSDGTPDVSTKYVLDFDLNIDDVSDTAHYYGKTFSTTGTATTNVSLQNGAYATTSTGESVVPKKPANARTVQQLRDTLEAAHYHERIVDVTSSYVTLSDDRKTVTIKFPNGLVGDDALPNGREWELIIDKDAFRDDTGNYFGRNAVGEKELIDSRQIPQTKATNQDLRYVQSNVTSGDSWKRGRTSTTSPVVLIQTSNGKDSFWSSGVATPVVRVDRYSYGFGMYQVGSDGQKQSSYVSSDTTAPTAYVRVRIDCETQGATLTYGTATNKASASNATTSYPSAADSSGTYSSTTMPSVGSYNISYTQGNFFAGGTGNYKESCKQRIVAQASKNNSTATGEEGIFQTVVHFNNPSGDTGYSGAQLTDRNHFSIRGTTGWAGEPSIAPYPLRDSQIGSPYLKRCFREVYSLPSVANTLTKTLTNVGWGTHQIATASELSSYSGIAISITSSTDGNYGIIGVNNTNSGNKKWINSGSGYTLTDEILGSGLVSDAKSNGLWIEGQGTFNITIKCFSTALNPTYDYYWCSYEILVDSSFSGYSWHKNNYYDWCRNWGFMRPGEYTKDTAMRNWG